MTTSNTIPRTNHLITISHPLYPFFLVSVLHLRDSLFIWVGESSQSAAEEADRHEKKSEGHISLQPTEPKPALSEEEERQRQLDDQMEEELNRALAAAGRNQDDTSANHANSLPKGMLAREWAASMWNSEMKQPIGTSLYRTPSDIAVPMSKRLSKRLEIQQLHLSLSLPEDLFPVTGNMPAPPGANQALLAIEKGIEDSVLLSRKQVSQH
ncbi:unnamed protein product [Sympodiomycopsis kandeliae]